ncbi:hypothetical protein [Bradymonas sediminis]|uniref:Uncharacterized protein n=1 Tax=Bradymonas sediminis TaxID=1548548 RepID=A0A2Z4FNH7_9DELT|nr:hypothetical protein [Bradymonas sediminis]AWV90432.1 hypothetical protein DN745_14275 [Bradymonas sediminis]TDP72182.1 hypothetical protein DFR33_107164 [Bradymonas sediminis]
MLQASSRTRQIWVVFIALALLSACAPERANRAEADKQELKSGQQVAEAAARGTHAADIDSLVLASSSMDGDAPDDDDEDDADDEAMPVAPPPAAPDAGLTDDRDTVDDADASEAPDTQTPDDADPSGAAQ